MLRSGKFLSFNISFGDCNELWIWLRRLLLCLNMFFFFPFGTLPFHFNFSKADLFPFMMSVFLLILIVKFMW